MGSTFYFLAIGDEQAALIDWFDCLELPPLRQIVDSRSVLHFRGVAPLAFDPSGAIDVKASPVVTIFPARQRRSNVWSAGEVHFLATPESRFPELQEIKNRFATWLRGFDRVYDGGAGEMDYWLEGSIRNYASAVFALPLAFASLHAGTYFVAEGDSEEVVNRLCRSLALRGTPCENGSFG